MKIKKLHLALISCFLAVACGLVYCLPNIAYARQGTNLQASPRTIEVKQDEIYYQSILDNFDNAKLETHGDITTFEGMKTIKFSDLLEYDLVNASDCANQQDSHVKYNFSYDKESNIVTIYAEMQSENGSVYFDEISGAAFINDNNEIDAIMNIDGEGVLLSEMNNAGLINNCGWLSKLVKKIVKVAVVTVAVAAVVTATAAVVVATAGAAAPALVAAGVGITTSTATIAGVGMGVATGALFAATIGQSALKAGTAVAESLGNGAEQIIDKATGSLLEITLNNVSYAVRELTDTVRYELNNGAYLLALADKATGKMMVSTVVVTISVAALAMKVGISCYTPSFSDAYNVAKSASDGNIPVHDYAHQIGYFNHYHRSGRTGVAHAFYGAPREA